jgi:hypothetical protein
VAAAFRETGFIDDHNRGLLAEVLKRIGAQVITHAVGVPHGLQEQALHPIGARFSGVFGQLPPIFARRVTQDALQVSQHPAARLWTSKVWCKTCMQTIQVLDPATDIGEGRCFAGKCGMVLLLHLLLLADSALWFAVSHLQRVISARRSGGFFSAFQFLIVELKKCNCSVMVRSFALPSS